MSAAIQSTEIAGEPVFYTVHYAPKFSPITPADECKCSGPDAMVVGGRIEGRDYTCDAVMCMACGTIKPVAKVYENYFRAFAEFWKEFGWHSVIGARLQKFARMATTSEFGAYMALRGWAPEDIRAQGIRVPNERYERSKRALRRKPRLQATKRWSLAHANLLIAESRHARVGREG